MIKFNFKIKHDYLFVHSDENIILIYTCLKNIYELSYIDTKLL